MLVTLEILQKTLDKYQEVYQEVEKMDNDLDNIKIYLYNNYMIDGICNYLWHKHGYRVSYVSIEMNKIYRVLFNKEKRGCNYYFITPEKRRTKKGILSSLNKRIQFLKQAVEYGTKNNLWRNS